MGGSIGARPGEVAHDRSGGGGLGAGPVGVVAAFPGGPRPQGAAALGAGVRARPAGSRRAQERAADGGAGRAGGLRPAAPLHQQPGFISSPAWQTAPLAAVLAREADRLVGGAGAVLIIDDTALPKKGEHSVGVARQYAGVLGKTANCQALVSLSLARGEVPAPVALRLYLPNTWCRDRRRCDKAGVPADCRAFRGKGANALDELDRLRAAGVRFGCALADAGYGSSAAFRRGLAARAPLWAVGIPKTQGVYSAAVTLSWPAAQGTGRPRRPAWGPEPAAGHGRSRPEASALAPDQLAARQQGPAHGQLRRPAGAGGRRPAVADRAPLAWGGAVAGRRAAQQRRAEVLSRQPSARHAPADPRGDDQGPLGLRAGAPADEGRTRPRPLRGALLGRAAPPRPDGADRPRLPAAPAASAEWPAGGKTAPPVRHPARPCPPSAAPCWPNSPPSSGCDVPNAARSSSCTGSNESAEVVLVGLDVVL